MSHVPPSSGLDPRHILAGAALERALLVALGGCAGWLAIGSGVLLAVRRLSGGVTAVPGPAPLAAICITGGLLVAVGDLAVRQCGGRRPILARLGFFVAAVAAALPIPAGRPGTAVMAITCIACAAALLVQTWADRLERPRRWRFGQWPRAAGDDGLARVPPAIGTERRVLFPPAASDEHLLQQQVRFTRPDGSECVRGRLFLAVAAGVRTASGHVGFCPPFQTTPTVEVSTAYDGVEVVIVAADVLPWGVRVECRLDEPADESFEVPIDVIASVPASFPTCATAES